MQHSVKEIAKRYSELSDKRKDTFRFDEQQFIEFASNNKKKYSLIENGNDLLVSTWYSDDLIEDYRNSITIICENCKKFHILSKIISDICTCGCKTFSKTHYSNSNLV